MDRNNRGLIRRVDTLGRVVIPKEVRLALHIDYGDLMEFCLLDNNVVHMKKFYILSDLKEIFFSIINLVQSISKTDIYIFDIDKLICFNHKMEECVVTKEFGLILALRKEQHLSNVEIVKDLVLSSGELYPIICNGDYFGSVVVSGQQAISVGRNLQRFLQTYLS